MGDLLPALIPRLRHSIVVILLLRTINLDELVNFVYHAHLVLDYFLQLLDILQLSRL